MDPAPSNSLRHALAIVAVASAGVIHEYLPAPPPQNSLLDWVHTGGEAAPFLRFAGRFSSPESLALSTTRWPEQNVQIQESIVSDLPHETQCNAYLSAPQLFSHVWHDIKSFATLCQKDLGDRRRRDWPASIEEQLGGPLNRALKVLDTDSDVSRVVIWPKFPDPEQPERNTRALVRQSFRGGVLGSGAAAPALRAAQRDGDYLHWHSVAAGSLIAMLATQSLTLGALAVIPGLLSVAAAHRLFASLGGPSTLATLVAHAVTYAVLLIASVRVVRACAAALEEERSPKVRITLWRVCAWIGASATLAASLLLSDVPAVQQFAGTLALGLALGIPLVAAILPALARPTPALVAPHPLRKGLPRWLELAGLGVFMASVGILGARIAYDATAGFNTGFTSLPIVRDYWPAVEYYWPTVQYYWASVQWLVTPLPVLGLWLGAPLAMGAGLRGARHVRAVFAEWFPASAGLGKLPVVLPWQVLGVLSLLFIVAAPRLHRWLEHSLQPGYPTWLVARTVPASAVEAFEVVIDTGAPGASAEALQRVAHFGRALDSLPGLRGRIDPALLVAEASHETWDKLESPGALSRAALRPELVPAFDALISTDGRLLRSTLWADTTPERTARQIASELEALLAREDWGFSSASVTGTWQLRDGLVTTQIVVGMGLLGVLFGLAAIGTSRIFPS